MVRRVLLPVIAALLVLIAGRSSGPISAEVAMPMLKATEPADMCAWPDDDLRYSLSQAAQARNEDAIPRPTGRARRRWAAIFRRSASSPTRTPRSMDLRSIPKTTSSS